MATCGEIGFAPLSALLERFGLELHAVEDGDAIPHSYWGAPEAGIAELRVWARADTPIHSLLHEACHTICMDAERRHCFATEAGGEDVEENAVCYLQILLADAIDGVGRDRLMRDMDAWGYSFRLGSTAAWFEDDADDALDFLLEHRLVETDRANASGRPSVQIAWRLRA